mgnify:CR=1 FL=1
MPASTRRLPPWLRVHPIAFLPMAVLMPVAYVLLTPLGGDQVLVRGQPKHVNAYAKDFLFESRQLHQPVHALSGGERNRLTLAMALAKPSNLLILDEPTNDLDMDTLDLLQDVLADFDGTVIVVSHDRDFLDRLATSIVAVEGDGVVEEYPGGYSDYLDQRKVAERIKAIARENGIPCIENKPLARALLAAAKVGQMIPSELYVAVAEILAFVIRRRMVRGQPLTGVTA